MWTIFKTFFEFVIQLHGSSVGKESACSAEDPGSISGLGRLPGEGNGKPLQYSCLENPMDREQVGYRPWYSKMAPHSSTSAWKIPWTEEPGRLQSMGSLGVGQDWEASLSLFTFLHWRRKWQLTPVFLPGESRGRRSLVGCRLWGRTELDVTEAT